MCIYRVPHSIYTVPHEYIQGTTCVYTRVVYGDSSSYICGGVVWSSDVTGSHRKRSRVHAQPEVASPEMTSPEPEMKGR